MALVDVYDTHTGKKLGYRMPEHYVDHPVLGARVARVPSSGVAPAEPEAPPADPGTPEQAVQLKGAELDAALEDADLPKTGTADEKRARLAEHRATPETTDVTPGAVDTTDTPAAGEN